MKNEFEAAKDVFEIKFKTARALLNGWEVAEATAIRNALTSGTCEGARREMPWVFAADSVRRGNFDRMMERLDQRIERLLSLDESGTIRRLHDLTGASGLRDIRQSDGPGKKAADALREQVGESGPLSEAAAEALAEYKGDRDWAPMMAHLAVFPEMMKDPDVADAAPYLLAVSSEVIDSVIEAYDSMIDLGIRPGRRSLETFPDYPVGNPFDQALINSVDALREMLPAEDDYGYGM